MQSTNSEYGLPYLATCHFHFSLFTFEFLRGKNLTQVWNNSEFASIILLFEYIPNYTTKIYYQIILPNSLFYVYQDGLSFQEKRFYHKEK